MFTRGRLRKVFRDLDLALRSSIISQTNGCVTTLDGCERDSKGSPAWDMSVWLKSGLHGVFAWVDITYWPALAGRVHGEVAFQAFARTDAILSYRDWEKVLEAFARKYSRSFGAEDFHAVNG